MTTGEDSNIVIEGMGEGNTKVLANILESESEAQKAFNALMPGGSDGVQYDQYHAKTSTGGLHRLPRKMAFQATPVADGVTLWYRCTMAQVPENIKKMTYHPWSETVNNIKKAAEKRTGLQWNLAHIIYYENESDSMGFHSDTFLDLTEGSTVGVVSLGSEREMVMHKKDEVKETDNDPTDHSKTILPHNSLLILDEITNSKWVHGIHKIRPTTGPRIAIVFRNSGTCRLSNGITFGQRCCYKTMEEAIENAHPEENEAIIKRVDRMCELKNHNVWDGIAMFNIINQSTS